ncbi:hypothetical protein ABIB06_006547 [Bradyrhizobium sp. LB8.2]|uniref:hypothetical protein n=1 Tax=unclassified Bradyrhizobium TaxID=2631580 RepID=UPI003398BDC5
MMHSTFRQLLFAATALVALFSADVQAQAATVSTTDLSVTGLALTGMQNAASTNYFTNDGYSALLIKGGGSAVTATIVTQATQMTQSGYGTVTLSDQTVSIPSATYVITGPFPVGRWNNTTSSTVRVNMSGTAGVSLTAVRLPQ